MSSSEIKKGWLPAALAGTFPKKLMIHFRASWQPLAHWLFVVGWRENQKSDRKI
jgi:hypothetical protein